MRSYVIGMSLAVLLGLAPTAVSAQTVAAGLRVGTDGPGASVFVRASERLNVRASGNFFSYGLDGEDELEGVRTLWEGDASLFFLSGLVDFYPFGNAFHLSAGAVLNGLEGEGTIAPAESVTIQSRVFTPEEIGDLDAKVDFDQSVAPYVGFGLGNPFGGAVRFKLDVGAMYLGSPNVELDASGMLAPTAGQAGVIEANVSDLQWYPVVSLGFTARLF